MPRAQIIRYDHGIHAVDSMYHRHLFDAVHVIVENDRAALVDTATNAAAPLVIDALEQIGIAPEQVDWVMLTHVHLDHAGGAGMLMSKLPNAKLTVHPRGARHMIDPSKLWAGTCEVYGAAEAERMYGKLVPAPADRVVETGEGATVSLAGRIFGFIDTPGHARHHVAIRDTRTGHLFTGDTFGISYRDFDVDGRALIFPSSTPVQFDPPALSATIDRLLALKPEAIYLTHFAQVRDVPTLGAQMKKMIDAFADLGLRHEKLQGAERKARLEDAMGELLVGEVRRHGVTMGEATVRRLLAVDIELNSAGIIAWLDSR